jgi:predicted dehydrogenase
VEFNEDSVILQKRTDVAWKVKVIGAGSIGNHLSHASRSLGWSVDLCDVDPAALTRTREMIYPGRYDRWDDAIRTFLSKDVPSGGYDLIVVGTPPDSHIALALSALEEGPGCVLIEKPLCTPALEQCDLLSQKIGEANIAAFVGYDHIVSASVSDFCAHLSADSCGPMETLDVEFREHWGGIFAAHPWLDGPSDSYLGYWQRGGGAASEHSHALNLWQHIARAVGAGRVTEVAATVEYVKDDALDYDRFALLRLKTEQGMAGRVIQDVITKPTQKTIRAQTETAAFELYFHGDHDLIRISEGRRVEEIRFSKSRPDDFITELDHIKGAVDSGSWETSPIAVNRGLESMLVVAAAHKSAAEGRTIQIDYAKGFNKTALV